jgi:hypothetical protein
MLGSVAADLGPLAAYRGGEVVGVGSVDYLPIELPARRRVVRRRPGGHRRLSRRLAAGQFEGLWREVMGLVRLAGAKMAGPAELELIPDIWWEVAFTEEVPLA